MNITHSTRLQKLQGLQQTSWTEITLQEFCFKATKSSPWCTTFTYKRTSCMSCRQKLSSGGHLGSKLARLLNAGDARDVRFLCARPDSAVSHGNWSLGEIMTQLQETNGNVKYMTFLKWSNFYFNIVTNQMTQTTSRFHLISL